MKIDRAVAKQLFLEIGWNSASGKKMGDDAWVQEKLNAVPKNMPDDESEFEDPAAKALANAICKALEDGEEIEFELEGEVEVVSDKPAKGKKGTKVEDKSAKGKKGEKAVTKDKAEKSASKGRGRSRSGEFLKDWGPRATSEAGKLFRSLGKKVMSVANIAKKMEISEKRVLLHCNFWKDKGAPISVDNDSVSVKV